MVVGNGCYVSSLIGGKVGEIGGEVEETELVVLLGRLIRPPNEPSNILGGGGSRRGGM